MLPTTPENNIPITRRSQDQLDDTKRTRGLIFCKVSITYKENQFKPTPTDTTHLWKGATPILINRPKQISIINIPREALTPKIPTRNKTEATVWLKKYLIADSPSRPVLNKSIKGIKAKVFSSIPTQHNSQEEDDETRKILNIIQEINTTKLGENITKKKSVSIVGVWAH